jgi:hypothetical protein
VQILVVVAIIQFRSLKTDEEKVSMSTTVGHGSIGPKERLKVFTLYFAQSLKGVSVNIPKQRLVERWQHRVHGLSNGRVELRFLCILTA